MAKSKKAGRRSEAESPVRKVILIDDHPMMRCALMGIVEEEQDLTVCGEAADAAAAVELVRRQQPDAAIVDLHLKVGHGLETIQQLCEMRPGLACLVYSMLDESYYAERAIAAGVLGYLNKRASSEQVVEALRTVLDGHIYLSTEVASRLLRRGQSNHNGEVGASAMDSLTDRELEVFELIAEGKNVQQIAEHLSISAKTADTHRQSIKRKLGVTDNGELMRLAFEWSEEQA